MTPSRIIVIPAKPVPAPDPGDGIQTTFGIIRLLDAGLPPTAGHDGGTLDSQVKKISSGMEVGY